MLRICPSSPREGLENWNTFTKGLLREGPGCFSRFVFHFRTFTIRQVKEYLAEKGLPVAGV